MHNNIYREIIERGRQIEREREARHPIISVPPGFPGRACEKYDGICCHAMFLMSGQKDIVGAASAGHRKKHNKQTTI
eukprot:4755233-Pyramimonas_sp.AAC.1